MIVTLFTAHSREGADVEEDYRVSFSPEMLSALERVPGFISYNVFFGQAGWWCGVVRWESMESIRAWRDDPVHRGAWPRTVEFYDEFFIQHAEVVDGMHWVEGRRTGRAHEDVAREQSMDTRNPPTLEELYGSA